MSCFTKVQNCITQKNTNFGHAKSNIDNIRSLVKAKKEIKNLLSKQKTLQDCQLNLGHN